MSRAVGGVRADVSGDVGAVGVEAGAGEVQAGESAGRGEGAVRGERLVGCMVQVVCQV